MQCISGRKVFQIENKNKRKYLYENTLIIDFPTIRKISKM
jgi:hypothetical protein